MFITVEGGTSIFLYAYDPSGRLSAFTPRVPHNTPPLPLRDGISRADLATDQCTLYYTALGSSSVQRFNVCTNTQQPDLATGLPSGCGPLRVRPNLEVLVACNRLVYLLNATTGGVLRTYMPASGGGYWPVDLDPDGTSFWAGDDYLGSATKIDIATGAVLASFPVPQNVNGLSVFGAPSAANVASPTGTPTPVVSNTPTASPTTTSRPRATLVVSAPNTIPLQTVTVTGTAYGAWEIVGLFWDTNRTPLTETMTTQGGVFTARVVVPQATTGLHALTAIGQQSGRTASVIMHVYPWLILYPASTSAGGRVGAAGLGFGAQEAVTLYWDKPSQLVGTTTTTALGSFSGAAAVTVTIPLSATVGLHTIYGVGHSTHAVGLGRVEVR